MSTAPLQSPDLDWLSLSSGLWASAAAVQLRRLTEHPLPLPGTVCVRLSLRTLYVCICVCRSVEPTLKSRREWGKESDVSGLVRIEGGIRICLALIWHQYLCPHLCFLSLSCHSLLALDNVSLDYVIGLTTWSTPHPSATLPLQWVSPFLPCIWPAPPSSCNALDVYLEKKWWKLYLFSCQMIIDSANATCPCLIWREVTPRYSPPHSSSGSGSDVTSTSANQIRSSGQLSAWTAPPRNEARKALQTILVSSFDVALILTLGFTDFPYCYSSRLRFSWGFLNSSINCFNNME